jgi:hypothetical protein
MAEPARPLCATDGSVEGARRDDGQLIPSRFPRLSGVTSVEPGQLELRVKHETLKPRRDSRGRRPADQYSSLIGNVLERMHADDDRPCSPR